MEDLRLLALKQIVKDLPNADRRAFADVLIAQCDADDVKYIADASNYRRVEIKYEQVQTIWRHSVEHLISQSSECANELSHLIIELDGFEIVRWKLVYNGETYTIHRRGMTHNGRCEARVDFGVHAVGVMCTLDGSFFCRNPYLPEAVGNLVVRLIRSGHIE